MVLAMCAGAQSPVMLTLASAVGLPSGNPAGNVVVNRFSADATLGAYNATGLFRRVTVSPARSLFLVDRSRFFVQNLTGTPWLMLDTGRDLDGDGILPPADQDDLIPMAKNVIDMQVAYTLDPCPGYASGPDSNGDWIVGDVKGEPRSRCLVTNPAAPTYDTPPNRPEPLHHPEPGECPRPPGDAPSPFRPPGPLPAGRLERRRDDQPRESHRHPERAGLPASTRRAHRDAAEPGVPPLPSSSDHALPPPRGAALSTCSSSSPCCRSWCSRSCRRASTTTPRPPPSGRPIRASTCAEAGRELLLSQFRAYGATPTQLTLNTTMNDQKVSLGALQPVRDQVDHRGRPTLASTGFGASDMSNRIARIGLGGQAYRMVVVCSSSKRSAMPAHTRARSSTSSDSGSGRSTTQRTPKDFDSSACALTASPVLAARRACWNRDVERVDLPGKPARGW